MNKETEVDGEESEPMTLEEYVNVYVPERFRYYLLHQRGYADRFNWTGPDREDAKRVKERGVVLEWLAAVFREGAPYISLESCSPPLPDCLLIDKSGRKVGVEVTELVDKATIERNKQSSYHWKEYSASDFVGAVAERLEGKNQKFRRARDAAAKRAISEIIIIMHCDEPDLQSRPQFCRDVLLNARFEGYDEIDEAFLLLPCRRKRGINDTEAEFCRPIRIPLGVEGRSVRL
jgi:hypothetical protein